MEPADLQIRFRRAYEPPSQEDGLRVLVERLWPRGLSKDRAAIHLWLRDIAPSPALRTWYGHDPAKWEEFRRRYRAELAQSGEPLERLRQLLSEHTTVTFVFAARDEARNSAVVLKEFLAGARRGGRGRARHGRP